jgi:hypothetical protein
VVGLAGGGRGWRETINEKRGLMKRRRLRRFHQKPEISGPRSGPWSSAEASFVELAKRGGIEPLRGGWPDFACFRGGKLVAVVEVKDGKNGDFVKQHQARLLVALHNGGIPTYIWTSGRGFRRVSSRFSPKTQKICGEIIWTQKLDPRTCIYCDKSFKPTVKKQVYCSPYCRRHDWHERNGRVWREPVFDGLGVA